MLSWTWCSYWLTFIRHWTCFLAVFSNRIEVEKNIKSRKNVKWMWLKCVACWQPSTDMWVYKDKASGLPWAEKQVVLYMKILANQHDLK